MTKKQWKAYARAVEQDCEAMADRAVKAELMQEQLRSLTVEARDRMRETEARLARLEERAERMERERNGAQEQRDGERARAQRAEARVARQTAIGLRLADAISEVHMTRDWSLALQRMENARAALTNQPDETRPDHPATEIRRLREALESHKRGYTLTGQSVSEQTDAALTDQPEGER